MTTQFSAVDGNRGESLTQAVARRLRGQLAELNISKLQLANITGLGRSLVFRRVSGETAMNTDELEQICDVTGISMVYLLTGVQPAPQPGGPGTRSDGHSAGWAPRDSNAQPTGSVFDLVTKGDDIHPFRFDERHAA